MALSVLALSSRFDGLAGCLDSVDILNLSVLALSSRFDGLRGPCPGSLQTTPFQYSLCRVVLMVTKVSRPFA